MGSRKGGRTSNRGATLAQSGGRNTTFGGGKGGTPLSRNVTKAAKIGEGRLGNQTPYAVRTAGGDNTEMKVARKRAGSPPPVHPGDGEGQYAIKPIKQLPPEYRGSTNSSKPQAYR